MTSEEELLKLLHLMVDGVEGYWTEHGYLRYWDYDDLEKAQELLNEYWKKRSGVQRYPQD